MNMTPQRLETLWFICNDQIEGLDKEDAEYVAEQWWAEFEWPRHAIKPKI